MPGWSTATKLNLKIKRCLSIECPNLMQLNLVSEGNFETHHWGLIVGLNWLPRVDALSISDCKETNKDVVMWCARHIMYKYQASHSRKLIADFRRKKSGLGDLWNLTIHHAYSFLTMQQIRHFCFHISHYYIQHRI